MKIYNQKIKQLENCEFINKSDLKVYTCGPTVYDFPHIGNWYTFIRYDALVRALRCSGNNVRWVMNITDVGHLVSDADSGEDKMEKGARREGKTAWDVAKYYGNYFIEGLGKLNFSEINVIPKATDYIQEQIDLVIKLEEKGFTYKTSDGVYFDTSKFKTYSDFAQLDLSGQEEGARVAINDEKKNSSDFALWKFSSVNEKRDMEWDSPWGKGFPGWHLECSAMIHAILDEPIDIHAGGIDHIPVHHTNEIAQTEAAFDKQLSRYWLHCNHIQVEGKKMSKSLGNFYTLEDLKQKGYSPLIFRALVLNGHYRSQSEFSWDNLDAIKNRLQNWVDKLCQSKQKFENNTNEVFLESFKEQILSALNNDLNTPLALSFVDEQVTKINRADVDDYVDLLNQLLGIGLSEYLTNPDAEDLIKISEREEARKNNDWELSDKLRIQLQNKGILIKDTAEGQIWSRRI
jgi:cysteinyl-tRNA synthetase